MVLRALFSYFENWIRPFARTEDLRPPAGLIGFTAFYVRQAPGPFVAMLILGGLTAAIEAATFWFVGRVVDILASVKPQVSARVAIDLEGGSGPNGIYIDEADWKYISRRDEVKAIVQESADFAQQSPEPPESELWTDVLLEMPHGEAR